MKKVDERILKAVEHVARKEVIRNEYWWPPICSGIFHQPKRPVKKR